MFKQVLLALVAAASLPGALHAEERFNSYAVNYAFTYSGADAITIQQSSGTKMVQFQSLTVYCSSIADCDIQIERDGTAATTTAQAVIAMSTGEPATTVVAFKQSNVGAGTVIYQFHVTAGSTQTFDISALRMPMGGNGGTRPNVTFKITSAGLPVVRILPVWYEENL